jgi:hypothetical protein
MIDERGQGLIELLIASAMGLLVLAVLLQFAISAHTLTSVEGETADLQQRLRVAAETIRHDLMLAGAGPNRGPSRGALNGIFPPILPARVGLSGADPELSFHADRISIMFVPADAPQTQVISPMASGASPIAIDGMAPGCRVMSACGFSASMDVLIYEAPGVGGTHEVFSLSAVDVSGNLLIPTAPLSRPYSSHARVAAVVRRTYYLDAAGKRLMMYDGARSDVPLVDHVVDLRFVYYGDPRSESVHPPEAGSSNCAYGGSPPVSLLASLGGQSAKVMPAAMLTDGPVCGEHPYVFDADLLRIRRVSCTIRLEAESAEFRARGIGFVSPGVSRASAKRVADLQATIDVAPRNMADAIRQ